MRLALFIGTGKVCARCQQAGRCVEERTKVNPLHLECNRCVTSGRIGDALCPDCEGWGRVRITGCPMRLVPSTTWELIRHATRADKGLMPIGGGTLEQTQWFLDACDVVAIEKHKIEQALTKGARR